METKNVSKVPSALLVNYPDGACLIEVDIFLCYKVPLRAFIGFSSKCSSHGSCCRPSSQEISICHTSMSSSAGSVCASHFDAVHFPAPSSHDASPARPSGELCSLVPLPAPVAPDVATVPSIKSSFGRRCAAPANLA